MKKIKLLTTLIVLAVVSSLYFVSCKKDDNSITKPETSIYGNALTMTYDSLYIGYRNASDNPIIDINLQDIENHFTQQLINEGAKNVVFDTVFINDNNLMPDYYPSLNIQFTFTIDEIVSGDTVENSYTAGICYTLFYDNAENKYLLLDENDYPTEVNGGRFACIRENCVGCKGIFGDKGKLMDCDICLPTTPGQEYSCGMQKITGGGVSIGPITININLNF